MVFTRSISRAAPQSTENPSIQTQCSGTFSGAVLLTASPLRPMPFNASCGPTLSRSGAVIEASQPLVGQKRAASSQVSDEEGSSRGSRYKKNTEFSSRLFQETTLVYDRLHVAPQHTRLRGTSDLSALPDGVNSEGLPDLALSGSAAINPALIGQIQRLAQEKAILVVDLRKEPHAVANNHSVTWTIPNNWLNIDKPLSVAIQDEQQRIHQVRQEKPESLVLVHHKDYKKELARPVRMTMPLPHFQSEQELVERNGMNYARIGVADHLRPVDAEVDRFVSTVRSMPKDTWLHVHCKGGQGRTTTFMVLYDILNNAGRVSLADIAVRQMHFGFGYDVASEGLKVERQQFRKDRWAFIQSFYDYAKANPKGQPLLWSEWHTNAQKTQA